MIEVVIIVLLASILGTLLVLVAISLGILHRIELHLGRLVGLVLDSRKERNEEDS